MKIYKFRYRSWSVQFERTEYEAEEKPKSYTLLGVSNRRILKREIGTVTGFNDTVYLLEDDKKKAVELLIEKQRELFKMESDRHLKEVCRIEKLWRNYEESRKSNCYI